MGVTGLWRLIEPSGHPVPLQTLDNKVLAVDVSIWLHQAIKGFQSAHGGSIPNAHLLGIYHRICKLLFFGIKPIVIFDGGVPNLKRQVIIKRASKRSKALNEANSIHKQLVSALLKHTAISKILSDESKVKLAIQPLKEKAEDIYKLPPTEFDSTHSEDESSTSIDSSPTKHWDLHTIDEKSAHFKALPADVRHDILTDLKETRKQSSWGKIHEMPKKSDDFSGFQMKRLLKRYSVQVSLEEVEKEMGGRSLSLAELETLLNDQGVVTCDSVGKRIASDENKRYLLIKDLKKALNDAKRENEASLKSENSSEEIVEEKIDTKIDNEVVELTSEHKTKADAEFEDDLKLAIELSLQDVPCTSQESKPLPSKKRHNFSFLQDFSDADFPTSSESEEDCVKTSNGNKVLESVKNYMMEYSGLTPNEVAKIMSGKLESTSVQTNACSSKDTSKVHHVIDPPIPTSITKDVIAEQEILIAISQNEKAEKELICSEQNQLEIVTNKSDENIISDSDSSIDFVDVPEKHKNVNPTSSPHGNLLINQSEKVGKISEKIISSDKVDTVTNKSDDAIQDSDSSIEFVDVPENHKNIDPTNSPVIQSDKVAKLVTDTEKIVRDDEVEITMDKSQDPTHDSDCSIDFVDVLDEQEKKSETVNQNLLEIIIKPDDAIEDDLFNDVFINKSDTNNLNQNLVNKPLTKIDFKKLKTTNNEIIKEIRKPSSDHDTIVSQETKIEQEKALMTQNVSNKEVTNETEAQVSTREQLKEIQEELEAQNMELLSDQLTKERMANSLTEQIIQETQDLLRLFGVPYIVAPMEAEAQCAFLEIIELTDGTITDDSDIWLFGGKTVYKNFFNQQKHVMEFRSEKILEHYKLTREQMILLALLVGSDYTLGVQGIGPVTALEILAAFPNPKKLSEVGYDYQQLILGLQDFHKWLTGQKTMGLGRTGLRSKLKNVTISEGFPSISVIQAYLEPNVDPSRKPFSWGKPDKRGLIEYARKKFGWAPEKSENILKPIIKKYDEAQSQKSIKDYFKTKHKIPSGNVENKMSKRVKKAVDDLQNGTTNTKEQSKSKVTKTTKKGKRRNIKKSDTNSNEKCELSSDEDVQILKKVQRQTRTKLKQIHEDIGRQVEEVKKPRVLTKAELHKREVIPQKQRDKADALNSKLKAIEIFRKSNKGPGFVQSRKTKQRIPKADAELSESSSD